jgi:beta-mannosidase
VSHTRSRRVGFRSVSWRRWILSVNGERLFAKGSNLAPTRMALAEATPEELRADVRLAVGAGLDLVRVHAHVSRPELYDAADEAGLLVWQDFPLQWGYARGLRRQAVRQAWAAVELLGHHPSVALWCAHNEPFAVAVDPRAAEDPQRARSLHRRVALAMVTPGYNRDVLDRSVSRALERADGTRPVVPHSGVWPSPTSRGTDSHLYHGWYHGDWRDLRRLLARFPRMARFVSEFGAQAVPTNAEFMEPERWPDLDWEQLVARHGLQRRRLERVAPVPAGGGFAAWREATQRYQATLVRRHVEHLRRLKYRPTGGFAHFLLTDGHPAVSWSVLDHHRAPKAAYAALAEACAPVIVVADHLPARVAPGDALHLDVHVVSDRRTPLDDAMVTARLRWPGGGHAWRWVGSVAPDACVRVGAVRAMVPDVDGLLRLELTLAAGPVTAANADETCIGRAHSSSGDPAG